MVDIEIKQFVAGQLENNMYLIADKVSKKAVLIDASSNIPELIEAAKGYDVEYILLTHGHFDHIMGLTSLKTAFNAKAVINKNDLVISDNINEFTNLFGIPSTVPPTYDMFVEDGETIKAGNIEIKVIATPGHTEGGVCYLIDNKLFSGDTLFKQSVGRTDLFGGNFEKLSDSIKNKLFKLDEKIQVYPGHGDMTTIEFEKKYNGMI